jgi:hypothetical protein
MTRAEKLAELKKWQAHCDAVDGLIDGMQRVTGVEPEAPFHNIITALLDEYTMQLARQLDCVVNHPGIVSDLHWYREIATPRCASAGGKEYTVGSLESLLYFIEASK